MDESSYKIINQQRPVSQLRSLDEFRVLSVDQWYNHCEVQVIPCTFASEYLSKHPGGSFLIPDGKDEELNRQLKDKGWDGFRAKRLPDGTQHISILNKEGIALFYYSATTRTVTPVSFCRFVAKGRDSYYAVGAILAVPATAALCLGIWGCAVILKRALMRWG